MARTALSALIVFVGLAALASHAIASPLPETLSFELSTCPSPELDAASLGAAVRSELEADGVGRVLDAPAPQSDGALTVRVDCDAALTARATLKASRTGRERRERIPLGDAAPSARARALALALAELLRADWPTLSSTQSAQTTDAPPAAAPTAATATSAGSAATADDAKRHAEPPPPTEPTPSAAAITHKSDETASRAGAGPRAAAVTLAMGARLRWFVDYQSVLLGGDLGADFRALRLRAEVLVSSASDALGSASLGSAALCVGYRLFDWRLGPIQLAGYPMASAGLTWLRGSSAQPTTQVDPATGFYGDVRMTLEASLPRSVLAPALAMDVGRASGFVARAGDRTLGATGGVFLGASAGARY